MRFTALFLIAVCLNYSQGAPLSTTTEVWTSLETYTEDVTTSERNGSPDYSSSEVPEYEDELALTAEDEDEQQDKQLNETLLIDEQQDRNDSLQNEQPDDEQLIESEVELQKQELRAKKQNDQWKDVQEMEEEPADELENEEQQGDMEYEEDQGDDQQLTGNDKVKDEQEKEEHQEEQLNDEQQMDEQEVEEQEGDMENGEVEYGDQPESQEEYEDDVNESKNQVAFKPDRSGHQKVAFNPKIQEDESSKPEDGQVNESEMPEEPEEPEERQPQDLESQETVTPEESDSYSIVNGDINIDDEEKDGATLIIDTRYRDTELLDDNPEEETSHFFVYIVFTALLVATLYIGYHNKRKIIAFLCGARTKSGASRRPNTADYQKLDQSW